MYYIGFITIIFIIIITGKNNIFTKQRSTREELKVRKKNNNSNKNIARPSFYNDEFGKGYYFYTTLILLNL